MNQLDAHCPLVDGQGHAPDQPQSAPAPNKLLEQMMARLVEALPAGRWLYELKFGGGFLPLLAAEELPGDRCLKNVHSHAS